MNQFKIIFPLLAMMLLSFLGCKKQDKTFGPLDTPSKPVLEISLLGKDNTHPNGDGSGNIILKVTSDKAISYKVDFGDSKPVKINTSNVFNYNYSLPTGNNVLTITVSALGKGGSISTNSQQITIFRAFDPKPELVSMLTGTGTKKWRVDKDEPGNLGVGPAEAMTGEWWSAAPNEKAGLGIYDDIYTFTQSTLTFTHTTNNDLFGKKEYLKDFDPSLTGTGDYTLTGPAAASYTEAFGYDGGAGGVEYITFANKGHLGMYLGVHKYQVISRTNTKMYLKCLQDPGAWFVKIVAVP
ncbi:MAG: hypothetical protein ABIW47_18745 [Ginsengibacter sp.]|jgi:hypothetical protein